MVTNSIIDIAKLYLCNKSHKGPIRCTYDTHLKLPFLSRKYGIETLEEFKLRTCTIILVYSVFYNLAMQIFIAIQSRDSYAILSNSED